MSSTCRCRRCASGATTSRYCCGTSSTCSARQYQIVTPVISKEALDILVDHGWPGNVRELKNVVERLVIRSSGGEIRREDLPLDVVRVATPAAPAIAAESAAARGGRALRSDREGRSVVLVGGLCAVHLTRSDAGGSARAGEEGSRAARRATTRCSSSCSTCRPTTTNGFWDFFASTTVTCRFSSSDRQRRAAARPATPNPGLPAALRHPRSCHGASGLSGPARGGESPAAGCS